MNQAQHDWIEQAATMAKEGGHIYPEMAACEAALESNFGKSTLAKEANNLFGQKQHQHPDNGTLVLPTKEYLDHKWVTVNADWECFPSLADCFKARMDTLQRLRGRYEYYDHALKAADPVTFVLEVSRTWSTDPNRGPKIVQLYHDYKAQAPEA